MAYETLNLGLELTLPTTGTRNWGQTLKNTTWTKISGHDHTQGGDGNQIPTAGIVDDAITTAKLAPNLGLTQKADTVVSGLNQSVAIDWDNGMIQVLDCTAATGTLTITMSDPQPGATYRLFFKQPATALAITWPVSVKWPQGQAPIFTESSGAPIGLTGR
jgi:hypothetical protein